MTDRELMQEALYALTYVGDAKEIYSDTIESLRARLAQPEPEELARLEQAMIEAWKPIPQREWQGLTDEQVKQIEMSASSKLSAIYLAEAQLKGKNYDKS